MKDSSLPLWKSPPQSLRLKKDSVHVWRVYAPAFEPWSVFLKNILSADECAVFRRMRNREGEFRSSLGRATLRILMSNYTGIPAEELKFSLSPFGKPQLVHPTRSRHLEFNISHSRDWIVLAFGHGLKVGVDVEFVDEDFPAFAIAARFLSNKEASAILASRMEQTKRFFFDIWVRKEAYVKAAGMGLNQSLDSFEVPLDSHRGCFHSFRGDPVGPGETKGPILFCDLPVQTDYASCMVGLPVPTSITLYDWNPSDMLRSVQILP